MCRGSMGGYGRRVWGSKRTTLVGYCRVHRTARRANYSDIRFSPDVVIAQFDVLLKLMKWFTGTGTHIFVLRFGLDFTGQGF